MPSLELTDDQVIRLARQLPPSRRGGLLQALLDEQRHRWEEISHRLQPRIQALAEERGRGWGAMTKDERERFTDDLLHED